MGAGRTQRPHSFRHPFGRARAITIRAVADNFSTEVAQVGDETIIHVRGEIDVATCERLRDTIEPHLGPQQAIVLDLSEVEFMDSSCLRVLQQARGTLTADGGSLFLRNPSRVARRTLTVAQAQDLLEVGADDESAEAG